MGGVGPLLAPEIDLGIAVLAGGVAWGRSQVRLVRGDLR